MSQLKSFIISKLIKMKMPKEFICQSRFHTSHNLDFFFSRISKTLSFPFPSFALLAVSSCLTPKANKLINILSW